MEKRAVIILGKTPSVISGGISTTLINGEPSKGNECPKSFQKISTLLKK